MITNSGDINVSFKDALKVGENNGMSEYLINVDDLSNFTEVEEINCHQKNGNDEYIITVKVPTFKGYIEILIEDIPDDFEMFGCFYPSINIESGSYVGYLNKRCNEYKINGSKCYIFFDKGDMLTKKEIILKIK